MPRSRLGNPGVSRRQPPGPPGRAALPV